MLASLHRYIKVMLQTECYIHKIREAYNRFVTWVDKLNNHFMDWWQNHNYHFFVCLFSKESILIARIFQSLFLICYLLVLNICWDLVPLDNISILCSFQKSIAPDGFSMFVNTGLFIIVYPFDWIKVTKGSNIIQ